MVSDFYNKYNLSLRSWCGKVKVFWTDGTYPTAVLIHLLEAGFQWDVQDNCWYAEESEAVESAAQSIIEFAENIRKGRISKSESSQRSLEVRDEMDFFFTLKLPEDYKNFFENLKKNENYIMSLNEDKWKERKRRWEGYVQTTADDDEPRD